MSRPLVVFAGMLDILSSGNVQKADCTGSSISIACWVVVFSPQIVENLRRGSVDGLSLQFIIVWLAGDVFNILGAVLQGVLPTMVRQTAHNTQIITDQFHRSFSPSTTPLPT